MHYRFLVISLCISCFGYTQPSDFIVLKKKGKTVRSYYEGTQIEFITASGTYRNALVKRISNDTIHIKEFMVRTLPTIWGTYMLDTLGSFSYAYHYKEIYSFGPKKKGFNLRGSGSSLMGGGILLMLGSGVVYLADRDKFSPALLGAAAGLTGVGYLLNKSGSKGIIAGKKGYSISYMDMTP